MSEWLLPSGYDQALSEWLQVVDYNRIATNISERFIASSCYFMADNFQHFSLKASDKFTRLLMNSLPMKVIRADQYHGRWQAFLIRESFEKFEILCVRSLDGRSGEFFLGARAVREQFKFENNFRTTSKNFQTKMAIRPRSLLVLIKRLSVRVLNIPLVDRVDHMIEHMLNPLIMLNLPCRTCLLPPWM